MVKVLNNGLINRTITKMASFRLTSSMCMYVRMVKGYHITLSHSYVRMYVLMYYGTYVFHLSRQCLNICTMEKIQVLVTNQHYHPEQRNGPRTKSNTVHKIPCNVCTYTYTQGFPSCYYRLLATYVCI